MQLINQYLKDIASTLAKGNATEHTYRIYLQQLVEGLYPKLTATNEPKRVECGAPDYVVMKGEAPIGHIEAKDINRLTALTSTEKGQLKRYTKALDNLIYTDYIDFIFYCKIDKTKPAEEIARVQIAKLENGVIKPLPENFDKFSTLLKNFCTYHGSTIKTASELAIIMADKAKMVSDNIADALKSDEESEENSTLHDQLTSFRDVLIKDITPDDFADVYAQTIAYGMFAARLHDPTLETFSRQEAGELIPKSNPFLRKLFNYIAGVDLDDRIKWAVDTLADLFSYADVAEIMSKVSKKTGNDPIIHFYETFLAEYNPKLRKSRGVWYTPKPVVKFIVQAVDDILKNDFSIPMGLADTSKTKIMVDTQTKDGRTKTKVKQVEQEIHKVQILDPATGTGTFLTEVIYNIHQNFKGQPALWSKYVNEGLIPRLHGFEILMASYAMAHLKLELVLKDTGYKSKLVKRLQIYLTNSLEEANPHTGSLFASWLSQEAQEANFIKRDCPVMVVLGNPPYAVSSSNKGDWIQGLLKDYKKNLQERKINLDDDYIKFLRYAQHYIEKNGQGVVAMITNNSFIDGITHRQMRKKMLEDFDKIYIVDLHGNSKKKETSPDGSVDNNVFDIMQGVSINLFVKTSKSKSHAKVYHSDIYGKRANKYEALDVGNLANIQWQELKTQEPYYFFVPKDFSAQKEYDKGFKISELFSVNSNGIETQKDSIAIKHTEKDINSIIQELKTVSIADLRSKYPELRKDGRDWKLTTAIEDLNSNGVIKQVSYRVFDIRYTYYTGKSKGFIAYPRGSVMKHMLQNNLGLIAKRGFNEDKSSPVFVSNNIIDRRAWTRAGMQGAESLFPLYLYPDDKKMETSRRPNLAPAIVEKLAKKLKLKFTSEKSEEAKTFAPIDILDYIYGILHSTKYRDKYKEFLKIDFPRIAMPKDAKYFFTVAKLGAELRKFHLMDFAINPQELTTTYHILEDATEDSPLEIGKIKYDNGRVYLNATQYFDNVPKLAWEFYIGGYQPAQKWLKDRKGRELSYEDINHYQKIITILTKTHEIMGELNEV